MESFIKHRIERDATTCKEVLISVRLFSIRPKVYYLNVKVFTIFLFTVALRSTLFVGRVAFWGNNAPCMQIQAIIEAIKKFSTSLTFANNLWSLQKKTAIRVLVLSRAVNPRWLGWWILQKNSSTWVCVLQWLFSKNKLLDVFALMFTFCCIL